MNTLTKLRNRTPGAPWLAALLLAVLAWSDGGAVAQDRWWERPQAPPRLGGGEEGAEAGGEGAGGEGEGTEPGEGEGAEGTEPGEDGGARGAAPDIADGVEVSGPFIPENRPAWRWRQVLSSPRIGGKFKVVAVDPSNSNRIYVGTQENTIVRSLDGGVTWRELELSPFVINRRAVNIPVPGLPRLGEVPIPGIIVTMAPPFRGVPNTIPRVPNFAGSPYGFDGLTIAGEYLALPGDDFLEHDPEDAAGVTRDAGALPEYAYTYVPITRGTNLTLLFDATRMRWAWAVRRIAICPNAPFPLLVATETELLGSNDEGLTYVRLMRLPGRIAVERVECSSAFPSHVLLTTSFGLFLSTDGGLSWDQDLSGWPGRGAKPAAFGPRTAAGNESVMVGVGHILFAGDPNSDQGLEFVYPDFNNSSTAPWEMINWIARDGDDIWLATNDGLRLSRDGGRNWETAARTLFSRHVLEQVEIGTNELGGKRIAVMARECPQPRSACRRTRIYASDDGGSTWFPFFDGATARSPFMMAAAPAVAGVPPRWWIVTGGELWATETGATRQTTRADRRAQRWARTQLRTTPSMGRLVEAILDENELNERHIDGMMSTIRERNLIPMVYAQFSVDQDRRDTGGLRSIVGSPFFSTSDLERQTEVTFFLWAEWAFRDVPIVWEEYGPVRNALYELRRQMMFIVQDAWRERVLHLQTLANGMDDPLQIESLKERIAALEAVIETWLRRPLETVGGTREGTR